jgi:hypothetical protein
MRSNLTPKPKAFGKMNMINVIADPTIFDSPILDTLEMYYESAYPVMPSPEPMFDLRYFTMDDLAADKLKKELRSYIVLVNLNDVNSPVSKMLQQDLGSEKFNQVVRDGKNNIAYGRDKWAQGQIVIYLMGKGMEGLTSAIKSQYPNMAKQFNDHDEAQLHANLFGSAGINSVGNEEVKTNFGIDLSLPATFKKANTEDDDNFIWFLRDMKESTQNLVVRKFPYTSDKQFSKDSVIAMRNVYGAKYISSRIEGSYMVTQDKELPLFEYTLEIDKAFAKEYRGVWELENDFKGGPFVTFLILNEKKKELIFVDGWVYGPGTTKREMIQQLAYIVKKAKLIG